MPSLDFMKPLFPLVLPPILFRHFQKFSKPLHSLWFQLPSIHLLPVMLHPCIQPPFLQIIFGKIPMVRFYEGLHLIVVCHPLLFLRHLIFLLLFRMPRHRRHISTANILKILHNHLLLPTFSSIYHHLSTKNHYLCPQIQFNTAL